MPDTLEQKVLAEESLTEPAVELDPAKVIPLEAARAHLSHWWREPVTGLIAVIIGVYDSWFYGHDQGLSSSLDEILVIGGIVLMAGSRRLFGGPPTLVEPKEK
jgi:hypothetical protein